jgi:hypothetical protein
VIKNRQSHIANSRLSRVLADLQSGICELKLFIARCARNRGVVVAKPCNDGRFSIFTSKMKLHFVSL